MDSSDDLPESVAKGILAIVLLVASALALVFMFAFSVIRIITLLAQNSTWDFHKRRNNRGVAMPFHHIPGTPRKFHTTTQEANPGYDRGDHQ
ncbi:MAG: hypothetical protein WCO44_09440 [Bacteroidota bacterium]